MAERSIKVLYRNNNVKVQRIGPSGPRGAQGEAGIGIPAGGNPNEVLSKLSGDDYDVQWQANEGEDKNFVLDFSVVDTVNVNHNLNKYPAVVVLDTAGDEVIGQVSHLSTTQLVVSFANPFSGRVSCN